MDVETALKCRRSVRRYRQEPVPRDVLLKVADMCRFAPSSGNRQQWELILIDDTRIAGKVCDTLAWAPPVGPPPAGSNPTAFFVIISDGRSDALATCAGVATYISLGAYACGIGSCWFSSVSRTELSGLLGIPDRYSVEFVVALGYTDEIHEVLNSDSKREVIREEGVTQVPKRPASEMIHLNFFRE